MSEGDLVPGPLSAPSTARRTERRAAFAAALAALALVACTRASERDETESGRAKAPDSTATDPADTAATDPSKGAPDSTATAPETPGKAGPGQWYRASFTPAKLPEIPIYMRLPPRGSAGTGKLMNGRHEADFDASWSGKDLVMSFPIFHAGINLVADDKGGLSGSWQVESKTWGNGTVPFRAVPVDAPAPEARYDEKSLPGAPIDLGDKTTVWRATFTESGVAKIEVEQVSPGVFNATVLFPTGNVVYLAGNGRGKEIRLSSLIGLSIYSISAEVDAKKKTLTGKWVSGPHLAWRETFKASRTSDFDVEVSVKTAKRDQTLSMPQLAGYAGKPLIVEVGGSWCDACKHAAEALRDIYGRYHDRGLEIVSLTYEFTDDTAYNKRQAETFKKTYQIPWEVISVDGDTEKAWEVIPQGIEGVDASAFPLTLFVRRDGTIHAIHASFAGPENAKEHKRWVEEYERGAAAIVGGKSASK